MRKIGKLTRNQLISNKEKLILENFHKVSKQLGLITETLIDKNSKFLLYRLPSNSPSPGHGEYLFATGNTLDELFENWIMTMKRGGYSITPDWIDDNRDEFKQDPKNYFVTGSGHLFYKLKLNNHI